MIELKKYPDRKSWLRARGKFGASIVPVILGLMPWRSPFSLWSELKGLSQEQEENRAMRRGKVLERFIIREYERESGRKVKWTPNTLAERDILHASPDAIFEREDLIIEAKSSQSTAAWEGDEPPLYVQAQVQTQLWVLQAKAADVVVLLPHDELKIFRVLPDEKLMTENVLPAVHAFAKSLEDDNPPWGQLDASDTTRTALNRLWKERRVEGRIEKVDSLSEVVRDIFSMKAERKALDESISEKENTIRAEIAKLKCDGIQVDGHIFELKSVERKGYEVKPSTSIQLRVRKIGD